jgi:hypothetical protein
MSEKQSFDLCVSVFLFVHSVVSTWEHRDFFEHKIHKTKTQKIDFLNSLLIKLKLEL